MPRLSLMQKMLSRAITARRAWKVWWVKPLCGSKLTRQITQQARTEKLPKKTREPASRSSNSNSSTSAASWSRRYSMRWRTKVFWWNRSSKHNLHPCKRKSMTWCRSAIRSYQQPNCLLNEASPTSESPFALWSRLSQVSIGRSESFLCFESCATM